MARHRSAKPPAYLRQAAHEVMRTWPTWWAEALYQRRIKAGRPVENAVYETQRDVDAHQDSFNVRVRHEGQDRACPALIAVKLADMGADVQVVTRAR